MQPSLVHKSKGKSRQSLHASYKTHSEYGHGEISEEITLEADRNPWAKLDRDFPSHSLHRPYPEGIPIPDSDSDLLSVSNH